MILDNLNMFANAVALPTSGTGTFNVGDVIDLSQIRDIGRGRPPVYLALLINNAVTSGGSATVQFILASDSQQPLRTDLVTENLHLQTAAIAKATLVSGFATTLVLPWELPAYAEFLGLQVTVGTAALTAGNVTAGLTLDPNGFKAYPSAVFA